VIARVAGLALDARAARGRSTRARAETARWVAANLLAIRGVRVDVQGEAPPAPTVIGLRAHDLTGALAAIASVPALLDPATLPWRWRLALRVLGLPVADRPPSEVLEGGASIARYDAGSACTLEVGADRRVEIQHDRPAQVA
jgi:hypothetical protein